MNNEYRVQVNLKEMLSLKDKFINNQIICLTILPTTYFIGKLGIDLIICLNVIPLR